jgi:hypothetical protein
MSSWLVEGAGGPVHSGAPALEQLVPVDRAARLRRRAHSVRWRLCSRRGGVPGDVRALRRRRRLGAGGSWRPCPSWPAGLGAGQAA